jgi:predicted CXXCH cytochrome family protein
MGEDINKFEYIHEPVKTGCGQCHDPHATDHPMVLKESTPALCYPCHEDVKKNAEGVKYQHDVVTEEGGCNHCHTPHASSVRYGLKADPMALCVSCHNKEIEMDNGKTLANFQAEIEGKKFLHGPVADKECNGCHIAHGSDHFRLLTMEYPARFYAPYDEKNYQLCFSCHPGDRVKTEETTTLTEFRNGSLNLHYLHVNKPDRGRTCRACHATHASNHPKHVREGVPYGKWEIPIHFEKTTTGGSCQPGCHKTAAYDREKPVDYSSKEEGAVKEDPAAPSQSTNHTSGDPNHVASK